MAIKAALDTTVALNNFKPQLNFIGKIRDPLHDTIPFTACEKIIIDRPEFQRLRRIHQTAFIQYVFPGATHTRFEHSLGSMHIAGLLYTALIANQNRMLSGPLEQTKAGLTFLESSPYLLQCLRFAALLHDCGHSPLSHSGERFMPTWLMLESHIWSIEIPQWLKLSIQLKIKNAKDPNAPINHEIYTLLIVANLFQYEEEFLSEKMGRDICAVLDEGISPYPGSDLENSGLQSLFHEVISGEIDADRMDYLLRDSKECGVVYGYFDLGRILDSLGFYFNTNSKQYHLALRRSGISAYEDYLRARLSMYNQVYFHKTATACEAMLEFLKKRIYNFHFPLNLKEYILIDDYNIINYFSFNSKDVFLPQFLQDLLFNRKLWKRVYEETIPFQARNSFSSSCPSLLRLLKDMNIPGELIESSTSLSRFSPKGRGEFAKSNLKVIVKNSNSHRILESIENHSNLINRVDEEFMIRRIFISRYNENWEEIDTNEIQKILFERTLK